VPACPSAAAEAAPLAGKTGALAALRRRVTAATDEEQQPAAASG